VIHRALLIALLVAGEAAFFLLAGAVFLQLADPPFSWHDVAVLLTAPDAITSLAVWTGLLLAAQVALLAPVRRPAPMRERGHSVWVSAAAGGFLGSLLFTALVFAALEWAPVGNDSAWAAIADKNYGGWALLAIVLLAWLIATPLLYVFSRNRCREMWLSRLAAGLFTGTIFETAAIIPLDVMVRRRSDCYCATGTFFSLSLCLSVGLAAFGPAVLLPIIARRRKRWYEGRCAYCGYEKTGLEKTDRCPECGTGWRDD